MTWRQFSDGFDIRYWPWWMNTTFFTLWGLTMGYFIGRCR